MSLFLGIFIFSFIITSILIIPFIDLLYKLNFKRKKQITKDVFGKFTPIFNKFHKKKAGTPIGGGLLIVLIITIMFFVVIQLMKIFGIPITSVYPINDEIFILFFTLISFALLGLYDDIKKFFLLKQKGFFGLRMHHKFLIQVILAFFISFFIYTHLGIDFINISKIGVIKLGWLYIPFAMFVIVSFTNAVNITDGLDGLAGGILMISLFGLWFLSVHILDTPLFVFIALWLGSLIAFLYFNIYPARIMMGDVGALAFGATLAVIGLLLGKVLSLLVIGAIFVFEIFTAFVQLFSKKFFHKKIFPAAPFHLTLQNYGWEESKIVQRAWLAQIMLTLLGLWILML